MTTYNIVILWNFDHWVVSNDSLKTDFSNNCDDVCKKNMLSLAHHNLLPLLQFFVVCVTYGVPFMWHGSLNCMYNVFYNNVEKLHAILCRIK